MALYRIMTDGKVTDFSKESEALTEYDTEKVKVDKAEITEDPITKEKKIPFVSYHICHHDELPFRPCVIIKKVMATKIVTVIKEV